MIRFFNTLSGKLEEFKPLRKGEVTLYACGPTVYSYAHIGNFRTFVFEDLLRRFLEYKGYQVKHVMNITDVDDKTIAGAAREGKALNDFTTTYARAFNEDLEVLNILKPTLEPKATAEISAMVKLIERLIQKDVAYVNDDSVYYRVASFPKYGSLSKKNLEKNIKGVRVDVDEYEKEEGADFVLWMKAREGEPSWDSPWSNGRPGWHIECSAMSMKHLGETIDIHAGGEDLIFPHHENEIAQSEAATGKPFVRYWLHAKHLLVDGEKMSKSKGNFYTLRDLISKGYDPMAIRYALLSVHYRQQLNFTLDGLKASKEALKRIRDFWHERSQAAPDSKTKGNGKALAVLQETKNQFEEAMQDDLNAPRALGIIFTFIKEVNTIPKHEIGTEDNKKINDFIKELDEIFGVFGEFMSEQHIPKEVKQLVQDREAARRKRDFKQADELRARVKSLGYIIEDTGKTVQVKKLL